MKRLQISEGNVMDSSLVNGLMLLKSRVDSTSSENSDGGVVAIIDGGFENAKLYGCVYRGEQPRNSGGVPRKNQTEHEEGEVAHLSSLGVDLLVVREGISDEAIAELTNAGIVAYRRFERE